MSTLLWTTLACTSTDHRRGAHKPQDTTSPGDDDDDDSTRDDDDDDSAAYLTDPCLPEVGAILFDLGETLVTEQGDLFYLLPETLEMIDALHALGIPIGIITNVLPSWDEDYLRTLLAEPQLLDEFDLVLLSSDADAPKPDPAIYTLAHDLLPGAPEIERTAYVTEEIGDIADALSNPTEGARAVGMIGVLVSDVDLPLADYRVDSLASIPSAPWLTCSR